MKISFIISSLSNTGGTERMTCLMANELDLHGYDVSIISLTGSANSAFELNRKVSCLSLFPNVQNIRQTIGFGKIVKSLRNEVVKQKSECVIIVDIGLSVFTIPALIGKNIRMIGWEHFNYNSNLHKKWRKYLKRISLFFLDDVVTLTQSDKKVYLSKKFRKSKITCIPNPIIVNPVRAKAKLDNKIAISIGRLTYQKGFDILIDIWSEIGSKDDNWQLWIVGDGELYHQLRLNIEEKGLTRVKLLGERQDIEKLLYSSSLYLMTSRFEGLPMVLLEAVAVGVPIVSFDCETGPSEIVKDNGYLIPMGNRQQFINKTLEIMNDDAERLKLGANSSGVLDNFDKDEIVMSWISLLNK